MNIQEARELFPYIKTGKIYFNHASTGPQSLRVLSALNSFLKNASEGKIDDYPFFLKILEETKADLGNYLNCRPEQIAFLDNTTNGINAIAGSIDWKKGDRIILNDAEFPANVYPFLNLRKKGVEIDFVRSTNGVAEAQDILNAVTGSTRLISVSQVQFLSGYRVNLGMLGKECRTRNIILSVDAIQGLGAVPVDVEKDNIDFLSCGIQKWMLGLQGLSFIYVKKELLQKMHPANIGWLSVKDAWNLLDYNVDLKENADVFQTGTVNTAGLVSLNASLKLFKEYGFGNVERCVLDNSSYLTEQIKATGLKPMSDCGRTYLSGIVAFKHPDAQKLVEYLESKNIICSMREGAVRIAPHFYNTREDIDIFIKTLKEII